jgi:hypothetical protein
MWVKTIQYVTVIMASSFKYAAGAFSAKWFNLSIAETVILMVIGMMLAVTLLTTLFGDIFYGFLKKTVFKNTKVFSDKSRRIVKVWSKWGLLGIAFFTPILFSPVGGTLIAISFGEHKNRIIGYMFASAVFWAPLTALFADSIMNFFHSLF